MSVLGRLSSARLGEGHDFKCPHCGKELEVQEWDTEYGGPVIGENIVECFACRQDFTLDVQREITYTAH